MINYRMPSYTLHEQDGLTMDEFLDAHPEINYGDIITYMTPNQQGLETYEVIKSVKKIGNYLGLYTNQNGYNSEMDGGKKRNRKSRKSRKSKKSKKAKKSRKSNTAA